MMAKLGAMKSKVGGILRVAGQFPVNRKNGKDALEIAKTLLEEERAVGIFPEGTRGTGRGESIKAGVAWLAVHGKAPVVPAAILGTRPAGASVGYIPRFRHRAVVVFGEPIVLPEGLGDGREAVSQALEIIQERFAAHIRDAQELTGVYLPGDEGERDERDMFRNDSL